MSRRRLERGLRDANEERHTLEAALARAHARLEASLDALDEERRAASALRSALREEEGAVGERAASARAERRTLRSALADADETIRRPETPRTPLPKTSFKAFGFEIVDNR